jgi:hypothetical protein
LKAFLPKRPSVGFIAVCLTYCLVAAFFLWGFSTPGLDRVWTLHHLLKTGELDRLTPEDREILSDALVRHEALADALLDDTEIGIISANLDGWIATPCVTLLRTRQSGRFHSISMDVQTPQDLMPFSIVVKGDGWKKKLDVKNHGRFKIDMPKPPNAPEIVEVILKGVDFEADPSVLGIKMTFEEKR